MTGDVHTLDGFWYMYFPFPLRLCKITANFPYSRNDIEKKFPSQIILVGAVVLAWSLVCFAWLWDKNDGKVATLFYQSFCCLLVLILKYILFKLKFNMFVLFSFSRRKTNSTRALQPVLEAEIFKIRRSLSAVIFFNSQRPRDVPWLGRFDSVKVSLGSVVTLK